VPSGSIFIMNILALVLFALAILTAFWVRHVKAQLLTSDRRYRTLEADHLERDLWLDWLMREYVLNVADPYVNRPTIVSVKQGLPIVDRTEKRCFHCNAPLDTAHQASCPWVLLRPLAKKLYPTAPAPAPAPKTSPIGLSLTP
jgi:hypothetical protein